MLRDCSSTQLYFAQVFSAPAGGNSTPEVAVVMFFGDPPQHSHALVSGVYKNVGHCAVLNHLQLHPLPITLNKLPRKTKVRSWINGIIRMALWLSMRIEVVL